MLHFASRIRSWTAPATSSIGTSGSMAWRAQMPDLEGKVVALRATSEPGVGSIRQARDFNRWIRIKPEYSLWSEDR